VKVKVSNDRNGGSKNTISVQLHGATRSTQWAVLGGAWIRGEARTVTITGLREVGKVVRVSVTSSGKDGLMLDQLLVEHNEVIVKKAATSSAAAAAAAAAKATPEIKVGSPVTVKTGKYQGCPGTVDKFSTTTEKPYVCRDCTATAKSGISCCGSSKRTQCYYYTDAQITVNAPATPEIKVGSSVTVKTGKYQDCPGTIDKFSTTTEKPYVCRDCTATAKSGISCCGSSKGTQCYYYTDAQITANASPSTVEAEAVVLGQGPKHSDLFAFDSYLMCKGSKRANTWSCTTSLERMFPQAPGTDANGGCPVCPQKGQPGWQGDAPILGTDFTELIAAAQPSGNGGSPAVTSALAGRVVGPVTFKFGRLWVDPTRRGAVRFEYTTRKDCGCLNRHGSFSLAPASAFPVAAEKARDMQQTNGRAYPKYCLSPPRGGKPWSTEGLLSAQIKDQCSSQIAYDRGHMIPANHWDFDAGTLHIPMHALYRPACPYSTCYQLRLANSLNTLSVYTRTLFFKLICYWLILEYTSTTQLSHSTHRPLPPSLLLLQSLSRRATTW
jgi:transcription antitermination factor NusG